MPDDVKMIDFAKAQRIENAVDEGYSLGAETIVGVMESVLNED